MDQSEHRRQRLGQMLDLAQNYRGWTRKDLAKALGRDPTKLIPGSGIPKLDLVVDLADVLDWSVEDVVAHFWRNDDDASDLVASDFDRLDEAARDAHRAGQYGELVHLAEQAYEAAASPEQRARACNREAGGWDGLGRYQNGLRALQRGLRESPMTGEYRRMLQSNLANAYYTIWSLLESRAIASDLIGWYRDTPAQSMRDRKTEAFALYVHGHTARRQMISEPDDVERLATIARRDLGDAASRYRQFDSETGDHSFAGIAHTCEGGIIEAEVALGIRKPLAAIEHIEQELSVIDCERIESATGDELESLGWWCIFGCNVALRHLKDESVLQRSMTMFTLKAEEIAERLDNWAMRERVFTMEHTRRDRPGSPDFEEPMLVDDDDVRIITGTMSRFPTFRDTGWRILQSASVIPNS